MYIIIIIIIIGIVILDLERSKEASGFTNVIFPKLPPIIKFTPSLLLVCNDIYLIFIFGTKIT